MLRSPAWVPVVVLSLVIYAYGAADVQQCGTSDAQLQPSACGETCRKQTLEALRAIYTITNGDEGWNFAEKNKHTPVKGNWSDSGCVPCSRGNRIWPSYCCWVGVSCCEEPNIFGSNKDCNAYSVTSLQPQSGNITGPFQQLVPQFNVLHRYGLQYIDMGRNFLTGTIPPSIGNLTNLKALLLASNNLTGTVPATLARLQQLEQLDLEFNLLSGSLGQQHLCPSTNNSLQTLYLRANNFTGPLELGNCRQLQVVDIQENGFSGPLPVNGSNRELLVLRARQNEFEGELSEQVWMLPRLITLDFTNNSLSGELPQTATPSNQLSRLYLAGNNFSGSVPSGFADSSQLTDLDLGDNPWISGTLPNLKWMMGLTNIIISNTRVQGTIPKELGDLPFLQFVDMHNTLMTCCHTEEEALEAQNDNALVPQFLTLNDTATMQPIIDNRLTSRDAALAGFLNTGSNMMCPTVRRNASQIFAHASGVLRPANLSGQNWVVDPEYYWFLNCTCMPGFEEDPTYNGSYQRVWCADNHVEDPYCVQMRVKQCIPIQEKPLLTKPQQVAVAICGLAFCLLMLMLISVMGNMCLARTGKLRRQLEWWQKHLAGMPKSGKMSIVVTDIEGYSDLFKRCPELMYKALTLHNNVIRRCKYEHCGSTVQQEGDSYTLVFHDAFDAVSFCLQAQQALLEVNWPEGLMGDQDPSTHSSNGHSSSKSARRINIGQLEGVSYLLSGGPSSWLKKSRSSFPAKHQGSGLPTGSATADGLQITNSPAAAAARSTPILRGRNLSRSRMLDLFRSSTPAGPAVFRGLRVRMGIATGVVIVDAQTEGSTAIANILNSALYKLAVDVSDAGNGGQILMEQETFTRIKEDLHPLGAVDANGLNYNKLAQRTSLWHLLCLGSLCASRRHEVLEDDEAVVLDMGQYEVPSLPPKASSMKQNAANATKKILRGSLLPLVSPFSRKSVDTGGRGSPEYTDAAAAAAAGDQTGAQGQWQQQHSALGDTSPTHQQEQHDRTMQRTSTLPAAMSLDIFKAAGWPGAATVAAAAGTDSSGAVEDFKRPRVRLVQILAPSLVGRAPIWGNKLALKSCWVCTDAPYFEAPGALEAPLGTSAPRRAVSVGGHIQSTEPSLHPHDHHQQQQQQQMTSVPAARSLGVIDSSLASPADSFDSQQQTQRSSSAVSARTQASSAAASAADVQQRQVAVFDIESQVAQQQQLSVSGSSSTTAATAAAGCGGIGSPVVNPIPQVTMVFVSVEGAKVLGSRRKQLLKDVHSQLSLLLMEALRHTAGGYMCRMQEGDLKYMVAFGSAASALEWCLLVQEAAMYLNWPDDKWHRQRINQLCSDYDSRGHLVFRGPRLKMGVCEGVPRTIIPDHLGRADYHGSSINQAARFMDAGAHGGQIACEAELALAVLQYWQGQDQTAAAAAVVSVTTRGPQGLGPASDLVPRTHSAPAAAAGPAAIAGLGQGRPAAATKHGPAMSADVAAVDVQGFVLRANMSRSLDALLSAGEQQQLQHQQLSDSNNPHLVPLPLQQQQQTVLQHPACDHQESSMPCSFCRVNGLTGVACVNHAGQPEDASLGPLLPPAAAAAATALHITPTDGAQGQGAGFEASAATNGLHLESSSGSSSSSSSMMLPAAAAAASADSEVAQQSRSSLGSRLSRLFHKPAVGGTTSDTAVDGTLSDSRYTGTSGDHDPFGTWGVTGANDGTTSDQDFLAAAAAVGAPTAAAAAAEGNTHWKPGSNLRKLLVHNQTPAAAAVAAAPGLILPAAVDAEIKPLFGLTNVPKVHVEVQVHHLGSFRFKGNPQPLEIVNVMLSSLAGRQQYFPEDPPKGKGNRVAAKTGVAAAGLAPLPTLSQRYKARVPDHILHTDITRSGKLIGQHLRSSSMPIQRINRLLAGDSGSGGYPSGLSLRLGSHQALNFGHHRQSPLPIRTPSPDPHAAAAAMAAGKDVSSSGTGRQVDTNGSDWAASHGVNSSSSSSSSNAGSWGKGLVPLFGRSLSASHPAGEVLLPLSLVGDYGRRGALKEVLEGVELPDCEPATPEQMA